jgi:hypothetical protein
MHDLIGLFDSLGRPSGGADVLVYAGVEIPGSRHRVAKAVDGQPAILLATDTIDRLGGPPFALEHLSIKHSVRCRIEVNAGGAPQDETFSIVQCVGGDRTMHVHFLRAVGAALLALGDAPSGQELTDALTALVALFRAMANPPRKTVQGLWGELFLIADATDPSRLVRGWHALPAELFDFADGKARLEVKTAGDRTRRHHFRLEQLSAADADILVASLFVSPMAGGASAHDLLREIHDRVPDRDLALRIESVVADTLGNQWASAISGRFDRQLARSSFALFEASHVPAPVCSAPTTVTEIRFRSDLTDAARWEVRSGHSLFEAAVPRQPPTTRR